MPRPTIKEQQATAFRRQLERYSGTKASADVSLWDSFDLSDQEVAVNIQLCTPAIGYSKTLTKNAAIVSAISIFSERDTLSFIRSFTSSLLLSFKLPIYYRSMLLGFMETGVSMEDKEMHVQKLIRKYVAIDRRDEEYASIEFSAIDRRLELGQKYTIEDDATSIYFQETAMHARRVWGLLKKMNAGLGAGGRVDGLLHAFKNDRFAGELYLAELSADKDEVLDDKDGNDDAGGGDDTLSDEDGKDEALISELIATLGLPGRYVSEVEEQKEVKKDEAKDPRELLIAAGNAGRKRAKR